MRTAVRSAADIEEVGWPDPAAVLQRIESTRSCCPSWRANSRSVVASASVVTVISLPRNPKITGPPAYAALSLARLQFHSFDRCRWLQTHLLVTKQRCRWRQRHRTDGLNGLGWR